MDFFPLSLPQVWLFSKLRRFLPPEDSSRQAHIRGASEGWLACPFCFPCGVRTGLCPVTFFCLTYSTRLQLTMLCPLASMSLSWGSGEYNQLAFLAVLTLCSILGSSPSDSPCQPCSHDDNMQVTRADHQHVEGFGCLSSVYPSSDYN